MLSLSHMFRGVILPLILSFSYINVHEFILVITVNIFTED